MREIERDRVDAVCGLIFDAAWWRLLSYIHTHTSHTTNMCTRQTTNDECIR